MLPFIEKRKEIPQGKAFFERLRKEISAERFGSVGLLPYLCM